MKAVIVLIILFFFNITLAQAQVLVKTSSHKDQNSNAAEMQDNFRKIFSFNPADYSLEQNYPNPFNPQTKITFSVKEPAKIEISVYNIIGQKVALILNSFLREGKYEVSFDGSNLNSGIYFYNLIVNDKILNTKKMILLK